MQRHGILRGLLDVLLHRSVGGVERIRLGRRAQVHHRLRQREVALRHAEKIVLHRAPRA